MFYRVPGDAEIARLIDAATASQDATIASACAAYDVAYQVAAAGLSSEADIGAAAAAMYSAIYTANATAYLACDRARGCRVSL